MKLLLDQNLPLSLLAMLEGFFPASAHVRQFGLERAGDEAIWTRARLGGFSLFTRDADFIDIASLRGVPPKILLIRAGNLSTAALSDLLRPLLPELPEALGACSLAVVIESAGPPKSL